MPEEMKQPLVVTSSAEGDAVIVRTSGEVDAYSCEQLRLALEDALAAQRPQIVVDMADISFIDSSGLRVLIGAYKNAREAGASLTLRQPSDAVMRLLEITGQLERFVPAAP